MKYGSGSKFSCLSDHYFDKYPNALGPSCKNFVLLVAAFTMIRNF